MKYYVISIDDKHNVRVYKKYYDQEVALRVYNFLKQFHPRLKTVLSNSSDE